MLWAAGSHMALPLTASSQDFTKWNLTPGLEALSCTLKKYLMSTSRGHSTTFHDSPPRASAVGAPPSGVAPALA